ncbi:MAG: DNA mismatch repair endonuclease MutL [Gemmatimonadota bacterium]
MSRTIQVLPDAVANQIAAGEVVERPASVVKELVENSLDAGARRVEVRIEGGGKRLIRISDDGRGMGREDALLSLDRHATSKIRRAEDLRSIPTFGFRGEALPSIASVSRLTIETCAAEDDVGTRILANAGRITGMEDLARRPGTTVSVERLFHNAPARARFLGTPATEARAVSEVVSVLALANPEVAFLLHSGDRALLELAPDVDLLDRVAGVWGEEAASDLIPVTWEEDGTAFEGLIQRPGRTRPGFRRATLFLERRPFREVALLKAVDRGYRTTIPEGHRPWVVLFIRVPAGAVDVNVHPAKAEVRFRDLRGVERILEEGVRRALAGEESAEPLDPTASRVREAPPRAPRSGEDGSPVPDPEGEGQMALFLSGPADDRLDPQDGELGGLAGQAEGVPDGSTEAMPELERPRLWQVHRSWIMAEVRDGLLMIDQHAAHERILFEELMERFDGGGVSSQRLLFPLTLRLSTAECDLVEDLAGLLHRIGFEVDGFGEGSVIVHAVPDPHPGFDAERCFREMVEELTHGSELVNSARNQHERVAMSFACKAAIKAGQALDDREMQELFDRLFATRLPFHDVHGRPTTVRLSTAELERKFGR